MLRHLTFLILFVLSLRSHLALAQNSKPFTPPSRPIGTKTSLLPKWSDVNTWNNNRVPLSNDTVTIPLGSTVVMDQNVTVKHIIVNGTLVIEPTLDVSMNLHSLQVIGDQAYFEWGSEQQPYTKKGKITFVKSSAREIVPKSFLQAKVIIVMTGGTMEVHGSPQIPWTQINGTVEAGAKTITLTKAVDWKINDEIAIASTETIKQTINSLGISTPQDSFAYENEIAKIISISADKKTITIEKALKYRHYGGPVESFENGKGKTWFLDQRAEVGLLTRNILIQGDSASETDRHGVHLMVMPNTQIKFSNVEIYRGGIGGVLARYPFHWHVAFDVSGDYFKNNSVHRSFNRGVTIHASQNAVVSKNVIYDVMGHGIFLEDGIESSNIIDSNLVMTVNKPAKGKELIASDNMPNANNLAAGPAGIFVTHPTNTITNNRISGAGTGIWYCLPAFPSGLSFINTITPRVAPFGKLDNNTTHGCIIGLSFDYMVKIDTSDGVLDTLLESAGYRPSVPAIVTNTNSYKNQRGIWFKGKNITFDGFVVADNTGESSFSADSNTTFKNGCSVGHSNNSSQYPYSSFGVALSGGPVNIKDCHFVNYDLNNQSILNTAKGDNKHIYNLLTGITYQNCNLFNPFSSVDGNPANTFAFDLNGTFADAPNSIVCLDHPFFVDNTNFQQLKSKNGGVYEWGKQTSTLKFGQIRVQREEDQLNNGLVYYEWESASDYSKGGIHETGEPSSKYSIANVAVNSDRTYKLRFCDTIPSEIKIDLAHSYTEKDAVYFIIQGSPEKLELLYGASNYFSADAVRFASGNSVFWDASNKELHVKLVTTKGVPMSMQSDLLVLKTLSGKRIPAVTTGFSSKPLGSAKSVGVIVQSEDFDIGGQHVAYYSSLRDKSLEPKEGEPGSFVSIQTLPSVKVFRSSDGRIGEMVKINNAFVSSAGVVSVIENTTANEYWNYTFDFAASDKYDLEIKLIAPSLSNKIEISVNNKAMIDTTFGSLGSGNTIGSLVFPNLTISKGIKVIKIKSLTSGMSFDNFIIRKHVVAGLEQELYSNELKIYPNPTNGMITIQDKGFQKADCLDMAGKNLFSSTLNQIDMSALSKGIYFLRITSANTTYLKKVERE